MKRGACCFFFFFISLLQADCLDPSLEINVLGCVQGSLASPPEVRGGGYLEAEFLYWLPHEEGLEYGFKQNSPASTAAANITDPLLLANTVDGRFTRVDFEWQPAFRAEAGWTLPIDDWTLFARWTHLKEKTLSQTSITSIATQSLSAIWLGAEFFSAGYPRALRATAHWNLHYNVIDGGLSRIFHWSPNLVFIPQTGVRGFWINQRLSIDYAGGDLTTSPANFKGINNFRGAGLFGQLNSRWFFHNHWCILGDFLGSINFGRLKLGQQTVSQIQLTPVAPTRNVIHEILHRTRFSYQAAIGIEWSTYFHANKRKKIALCFMYELCEWFHLNQLRRFAYSDSISIANFLPMEGTLGFQGIALSGRFDF